jgi:hypothetical protein
VLTTALAELASNTEKTLMTNPKRDRFVFITPHLPCTLTKISLSAVSPLAPAGALT